MSSITCVPTYGMCGTGQFGVVSLYRGELYLQGGNPSLLTGGKIRYPLPNPDETTTVCHCDSTLLLQLVNTTKKKRPAILKTLAYHSTIFTSLTHSQSPNMATSNY